LLPFLVPETYLPWNQGPVLVLGKCRLPLEHVEPHAVMQHSQAERKDESNKNTWCVVGVQAPASKCVQAGVAETFQVL
jgi:hypothetical protein